MNVQSLWFGTKLVPNAGVGWFSPRQPQFSGKSFQVQVQGPMVDKLDLKWGATGCRVLSRGAQVVLGAWQAMESC